MSGTPRDGWAGRSDEELLAAAPSDPDAFGEFYDRHVVAVIAWFGKRTACPASAADLAAETFAEAYRTVHRYRPGRGVPRAWLFGIAGNKWRRYARTGDISTRALRRLGVAVDQRDHADAVAAAVDLRDLAAGVKAMLGRLSPQISEAVRLRVIDELPYEEVADRLGCSEGAARVRVTRGLATLRDDPHADNYRNFLNTKWAT